MSNPVMKYEIPLDSFQTNKAREFGLDVAQGFWSPSLVCGCHFMLTLAGRAIESCCLRLPMDRHKRWRYRGNRRDAAICPNGHHNMLKIKIVKSPLPNAVYVAAQEHRRRMSC